MKQFGLEHFGDAEYQLHEFQRLGLSGHAYLRRLESKVRAEHDRNDDWALVIKSNNYADAELEFREFMLRKIGLAHPGIKKSAFAGLFNVTPQTIRDWRKKITKFHQRRVKNSTDA
jgi:hypothetical protein